jgi:putative hemolysin
VGELVPKQLALRHPEAISARVATPLAALARISGPVVWLLGKASGLVLRLFGPQDTERETVTEEELKALLHEGTEEGVLETGERQMIERLLRLADKPVRAIMTPRNEIAWIDRADTRAELVQALKAAPYSRFVVCEGAVDFPIGVVQAKDILDRLLDGDELQIAGQLRQPQVFPDTVTALDALHAIVGDAEVKRAPGEPEPLAGEEVLSLEGGTPVDELKARLDLPALPAEGSYHTVAGLVLALLQRVPKPGDRIVFAGWRFQVEEMEGRRVTRVRVERDPLSAV